MNLNKRQVIEATVQPACLIGLLQGAAETRNRRLNEACGADYVIFWDEDILPSEDCIDEYLRAFKSFPADNAFAGAVVVMEEGKSPDVTCYCKENYSFKASAVLL